MVNNYTIEYRQRAGFDDWIYLAIKDNDKSRIYIYRDDKEEDWQGYNIWQLTADKEVDFDNWYWFEEKWDRDTTCNEINDNYLKTHDIPLLKIDEKGNVV